MPPRRRLPKLHLHIALLNIPTNSVHAVPPGTSPNVYKFCIQTKLFTFLSIRSISFQQFSLSRRSTARCDVCSSRHNCLYYCGSCDWDICENCVRIEREQQPDIPDPIIPPTILQEDRDGLSADGLPLALADHSGELCQSICSFSLDPSASRIWLMRQKILNGIQDAIQASVKSNKEKEESEEKLSSDTDVEKKKDREGSKTEELFRWETFTGYEEKGCTDPQTQSVYLLIATSMGVSTAILNAFTDFKQRCAAIEGIASSLVEIYKSFVLEQLKDGDEEKSFADKKTLLHDKPYAFSCPRGSPLDLALDKVELIMMEYWKRVHEGDGQLCSETLSTANASVSFIFIVDSFYCSHIM
mgnify:CR=1 FL=1